jgi:RNA polymerase sigma factor (sigma-70 family)
MFGSRQPDDEQIVYKIKQGDEKMLLLLYKRNVEPIRNYIMRNNGTGADVEDMLQEALVIFWQNVQKADFSLTSKIDTYLYAVAKNLWLKYLRKNGRMSATEFGDDHSIDIADVEPETTDEQTEVLSRYLQKLGETCRQILSLFYFEQWDMEQIAAKLRFANAQTAKAKKYQCKKQLEAMIRKDYAASDLL